MSYFFTGHKVNMLFDVFLHLPQVQLATHAISLLAIRSASVCFIFSLAITSTCSMSYFFTSRKVSLLCISFLLWAVDLHLYFLPDFGLVLFSLVHFSSRWYLCSPRKAHKLCAPPSLWEVSPALKNWSCCLYKKFLWNVFEILTSADMKLQQTLTFGICVPQLFKSAHLTGHPSGALLMDRAPSLLRLCTDLRTRSKPASEYIYAGVLLTLFTCNSGNWSGALFCHYIIVSYVFLIFYWFFPPPEFMMLVCAALQQRLTVILFLIFSPCIFLLQPCNRPSCCTSWQQQT